ncbi:MAG: tRNA lysidine(34) synthetase TilS, partial [Bacteroidota bacterium]
TFFINLLRGTGIRGVAGMAPKRNWFCHPLLTVSRKALVKYAKEANIKWREDASNATDDYLRNRIRHHLVPVLTDNFDYNLERWVTTADNLRSDLFLRDYGLAQLKKEYVRTIGDYTILDRFKIDIPAIFRVLLYELGKQSNFTPEQIRQMGVASGNKQFDSISDCAFVTPTEISFAYRGIVRDEPLASLAIDTFPFAVADGTGRRIFLTAEDKPSQLNHEKALYLAPTPLPLHLRPRQAGDRFQPLGLGGKSKKVKDYMIDQKIPVWLRDQIYLLVNEQNEIMAIPGYCISEKFKVLPEHEQVLCISWA